MPIKSNDDDEPVGFFFRKSILIKSISKGNGNQDSLWAKESPIK
jgi:hypothetical protein